MILVVVICVVLAVLLVGGFFVIKKARKPPVEQLDRQPPDLPLEPNPLYQQQQILFLPALMEETEYSVPNTEEYDCEYEEMVYNSLLNSSPVMVSDEYENNLPTWLPGAGRYENVIPVPVGNSAV
jgi:hypothetical protein